MAISAARWKTISSRSRSINRSVAVVGIQWELDGEPMESPIGGYGELLGARVEMLILA